MQKTKTLSFTKLDEYTYVLMHELSHQLSLPDHYCYGIPEGYEVCRNLHCDQCYKGYAEPRNCMMSYYYDLYKTDVEDLYCDDCIDMMNEYLDTYF